MTSRAMHLSLHSTRTRRTTLNGRSERFLDTIAFYNYKNSSDFHLSGRKIGRSGSWNGTESRQKFPERVGRRYFQKSSSFSCSKSIMDMETEFNIDIMVDGRPLPGEQRLLKEVAIALQEDAFRAVKYVTSRHYKDTKFLMDKEVIELSIVLCDDDHIHGLNSEWRGVDKPTDVLSFAMIDENDNTPVVLLGDIVISLDTAMRQAKERGIGLLSECRILLVHGLLHLIGFDHDRSDEEWQKMSNFERDTLSEMGWEGEGLISLTEKDSLEISDSNSEDLDLNNGFRDLRIPENQVIKKKELNLEVRKLDKKLDDTQTDDEDSFSNETFTLHIPEIKLIAIDLDGTLLDSSCRIRDSSRKAILAAKTKGIQVVLATGKARPGAIAACEKYDLSGDKGIVSMRSAGVFLQGLTVYDFNGTLVTGPNLSKGVVKSVFNYANKNKISCSAFFGDSCGTLKMTSEIMELHEKYYEPRSKVYNSIEDLIAFSPVKKILLLDDQSNISKEIKPYWSKNLKKTDATTVMALPTMLEIIPKGINKWIGLSILLKSAGILKENVMAIGDGNNDLEMIKNAGLGIAMGNASEKVKVAASLIVDSNDEDGIADAIETFVL